MLSISTSWMGKPEDGIEFWLKTVKDIGFSYVELSYKINHDQLAEFDACYKKIGVKVSSIHNFCPTPNDGPSVRHISNYYRLSSLDEAERISAVKWTKTAVDTAKRYRAKAVVIHAGTLDVEDERSPRLFQLYVDGKKDTEEFIQERGRILKLRNDKKGPYIDALIKSLDELMPYAQANDVCIGIETRYYPLEIPNFEEVEFFLNRYHKKGMYYWHDVGHAEINSRLGICPHRKYLDTYKDKLIGVHLHGIQGRRDHMAPFEGDMNLEDLLPYFGKKVIRVVESKPFADDTLMKKAVKKFNSL